jgi:hypothetical protein
MSENPPRYDPPRKQQIYYMLRQRKTYPVYDLLEWADWFEQANRTVRRSFIGEYFISTVFLSMDHSFFGGPPELFETMIFKNGDSLYETRCTTWRQALKMHREAKALVKTGKLTEC